MSLGEKLKKLRTDNNLSQEQLAEKLCVSRQAITKWEGDRGIPDIDNLKSIAQLFNVSIDFLVNYEEADQGAVIREKIDLSQYQKPDLLKSKYDAVIMEKYKDARVIYSLLREKKLNKVEWVADFITMPGIFNVVDSINNHDAYYLVETASRQLMVRVSHDFIESRVLENRFEGRKIVIGDNIFTKAARALKK